MSDADPSGFSPVMTMAIVLFGVEEIRACLRTGTETEQQAALAIALRRGRPGLLLVIGALQNPNPTMRQMALNLLRKRTEPEALQAIWAYLALPAPLQSLDYTALQSALAIAQWQTADELTGALVLALVNRERAWLREQDVAALPMADLTILDGLWRFYSGDRFGFTIQAQIWRTCEQAECTPLSYSAFDLSYCFSQRVGWHLKMYEARYLAQYDFCRKSRTRYELTAPIGSLPSTFALGGGDSQLESERGDIESTMGFYAPDRVYHIWEPDALFGHNLLRQFFLKIEQLPGFQQSIRQSES